MIYPLNHSLKVKSSPHYNPNKSTTIPLPKINTVDYLADILLVCTHTYTHTQTHPHIFLDIYVYTHNFIVFFQNCS